MLRVAKNKRGLYACNKQGEISFQTVQRILTTPTNLGVSALASLTFANKLSPNTIRQVRLRVAQCIELLYDAKLKKFLLNFGRGVADDNTSQFNANIIRECMPDQSFSTSSASDTTGTEIVVRPTDGIN